MRERALRRVSGASDDRARNAKNAWSHSVREKKENKMPKGVTYSLQHTLDRGRISETGNAAEREPRLRGDKSEWRAQTYAYRGLATFHKIRCQIRNEGNSRLEMRESDDCGFLENISILQIGLEASKNTLRRCQIGETRNSRPPIRVTNVRSVNLEDALSS